MPRKIDTVTILSDATETGPGSAHEPWADKRSFQAFGDTSAGAGAATIDIEVSNDGTNWFTAGTIDLTLATTLTSDGFTTDAPWKFVRANVTAISGTDAEVTVIMGNQAGR